MNQQSSTRPETSGPGLKRDLSVWAALGLSVALLGPSMAANINPQAPAGKVGAAVPLVFLLSMVGVLLVAHSFARLSQHIAHAGSVYGFIGATIGPRSGFVGGWLLFGTYLAFGACTAAGAALFLGGFITDVFHIDISWEVVGAIVLAAVAVLATRPAKAATTVLLVVEVTTIALMLLVAIVVFIKVGSGHGPAGGVDVGALFKLPSGEGSAALFSALTFGFLSFAGFEAASTLGEETRNPKRTIPIALIGTVLLAGAFFVVITCAEVLGFGTSRSGTDALVASSSLVGDLADNYIGSTIGDLVTLGAGLGAFGSALACLVGASRLLYSMGRDGFISSKLGATDSRGVPQHSVGSVLAVVALSVVLMRMLATKDVVDIFFWTATLGALLLLAAYLLLLVGATRFIATGETHSISRLEAVVPIAGIAFLAYVLYRNVWPIPASPYNLFPYLAAGWAVIGLAVVASTPGLAQRIGARLALEE